MAAGPVAAARARQRVAEYFLSRRAVQVNDAVRYSTRSPAERRAFEKLQRRDIVRTAGNDTWYLDVAAYERARRQRRRLALTAGAALGAGLAALVLRRRR